MKFTFESPKSKQVEASARLDNELKRLKSREDKVAFAKKNNCPVRFKKNTATGRMDIRIYRDNQIVDEFDCSLENASRILNLSDAEIASHLFAAQQSAPEGQATTKEEKAIEDFFDRATGIQGGEGEDISGQELRKCFRGNPEILSAVSAAMNLNTTREMLSDIVKKLNEDFDVKEQHYGSYQHVNVRLPNGMNLKVKIWKDMGNAMSFGCDSV